ncbi:MAG: PxxKW family cysteine-rich protein [Deltaproteobacteria bacterium]|nr:PxxKW family cysteine-rich protein [Deltaproteobacteria bacterium]
MVCQTIKVGMECPFMMKKGCTFNGGACHQIIEKCQECGRIIDCQSGKYCMIYPDPASKWSTGNCPSATHIKKEIKETTQKVNPLKASKRSNRR